MISTCLVVSRSNIGKGGDERYTLWDMVGLCANLILGFFVERNSSEGGD